MIFSISIALINLIIDFSFRSFLKPRLFFSIFDFQSGLKKSIIIEFFRERANVVDFDFATSCHFMPLQVAYATSSGVCHFEWRMPLRVAYATSSGVCHFEWRVPLRVACATSSGVCHFEWRADCVAFAFRVAYAT